jgi:hypothetical protein
MQLRLLGMIVIGVEELAPLQPEGSSDGWGSRWGLLGCGGVAEQASGGLQGPPTCLLGPREGLRDECRSWPLQPEGQLVQLIENITWEGDSNLGAYKVKAAKPLK